MIKSRGSISGVSVQGKAYQFRLSDNAQFGFQEAVILNRSGRVETISWDSSKRTGSRYLTRRCNHNVIDLKCSTYIAKYVSGSDSYGYDVWTGNPEDEGISLDQLALPANLPHMEALSFFQTGCVPKELQIANSLLEVKEIPRLVTGLPKLWNQIRGKHPDKAIASAFLGYEFGVKSLISDIKGLYASLASLQNKVAWLRRNNGKPVKVKFQKRLDSSRLTTTRNIWNSKFVARYQTDADYHAYAIVQYDVRALSDLELYLRSAKRQLGLTDLLSIGWEAIPFSWIVDHFIRIGAFLSSLPDIITLPHRIIHAGWCVKCTRAVECDRIYFNPIGNGTHRCFEMKQKRFFRDSGLPVTFSSLETALPSVKQLALEIAAGIQKM